MSAMWTAGNRLFFIIRQKNPKVLRTIKEHYNFSNVNVVLSADGYWSLTVSSRQDILRITMGNPKIAHH
jgi:hypothetical protein